MPFVQGWERDALSFSLPSFPSADKWDDPAFTALRRRICSGFTLIHLLTASPRAPRHPTQATMCIWQMLLLSCFVAVLGVFGGRDGSTLGSRHLTRPWGRGGGAEGSTWPPMKGKEQPKAKHKNKELPLGDKHRPHQPHLPPQRIKKPNIILIITDDQDVVLGSMNYMPKTLRILRDGGVHFPNAYVTTPMCCPSRSSLLTGMYVHNHNVFTNNDNCSSPYWQETHERRTFATYLSNSGYRTAYFGKYLNEYNGNYTPPGWRVWMGLVRNSRFYNYSININGHKKKHGDDYYKDYYPDLITNDSVEFLRHSKQQSLHKPIMMVLSFPAPHGPEDAAPQYQHMFLNVSSHRTPSWNYAPNPDKQWILRHTGKMEPIHIKFTDTLHTKRLQTLQSVDDAVDRIYTELKNLGELDNTYIFYTSDHGYHLGQFGLVKGKAMPFEFDVKVPMYVRGPKIPRGLSIPNIVLNLDLAPTLLDIAGVEIPEHMDGKSIFKILLEANERAQPQRNPEYRPDKPWRDTFLIESAGRRTADRRNLWRIDKGVIPSQETSTMTKEEKIRKFCEHPDYQSPCQQNQKWECVHDGQRLRLHKCRIGETPRHRHKNNCICPDNPKQFDNRFHKHKHLLKDPSKRTKNEFLGNRRQRSIEASDEANGEDWNEDESSEEDVEEDFDVESVLKLHQFLELIGDETVSDKDGLESVGSDEGQSNEDDDDYEYIQDREENISETTIASTPLEQAVTVTTLDSVIEHRITERSLKKLSYQKPVAGCYLVNGSISCTEEVYQSPVKWRENKEIIDDKIKQLKLDLENLKGIRKHLKQRRPGDSSILPHVFPTLYPDEEEEDSGSEEQESIEEESVISTKCDCSTSARRSIARHPGRTNTLREERLRIKEERLRNKERKNKKKAKYLNTTCNAEKMNCFTHDNHHWKTPPLWTYGPFCFCQNANNNTYWCLRTINETHNFLFCEFVTGFLAFYDLRTDPHQMHNIINNLLPDTSHQLMQQLKKLRECKGPKECTVRARTNEGKSKLVNQMYRQDVAAARLSKTNSRQLKNSSKRVPQKRRRQNG